MKYKVSLIWNIGIGLLAISALVMACMNYSSKPKIGYVHNERLLTEFDGFKEGKQELQTKMTVWQSNLDTLTSNFNRDARKYSIEQHKLSDKEQQLTEQLLARQEKDVRIYKNTIEQKVIEEEQRINQSMLNQVNAYLVEYGDQHQYTYIFGVTDNGSILYGAKGEDLTEVILTYINSKYQGGE